MCSDHAKSLESKIPRSLTKFVAGMMFPLKIVGDHIGRHGKHFKIRITQDVIQFTGASSHTVSQRRKAYLRFQYGNTCKGIQA